MAEPDPGQMLRRLFAQFPDAPPVGPPQFAVVPAEQVPPPYRELLVHDQHMTVTLERFHGRRVQLQVLARHHDQNDYGRMILLSLEGTGQVVEFGIFRMDLGCCDAAVRAEIVAGKTPLGRVLIEHDVLRHIDPVAFLKITPNEPLSAAFGMLDAQPIFGRLAVIFCNGPRAVELLEVVRPELPEDTVGPSRQH